MKSISLFEDQALEVTNTLYAGLASAGSTLSQKICGNMIDSKIDTSCDCSTVGVSSGSGVSTGVGVSVGVGTSG